MESFIGWIGGKRLLRKEIISRFPAPVPGRYIEVFGGAGWVLFGKEKHSGQLEVFNDIDGNLVNLYRCVKYHCGELQRELEWMLSSREVFFSCKEQLDIRGLTDIQRAARFFYVVKISFGNDRRTFATNTKTIDNTILRLNEIQARLKGVVIENRDFSDLIKVYDRKDALFYLDPPYMDAEKHYDHAFSIADHHRLRSVLGTIKGRFILSYNDNPSIRKIYDGFHIEGISRNNTLAANSDNKQQYPEVLIQNY